VKTVQITGKPGKSDGTPFGPGKFEQEFYATRAEMAQVLRDLAAEIEAGGRVEASWDSHSVGVSPCEPLKIEVQYKTDKRELEVQFKLKEFP